MADEYFTPENENLSQRLEEVVNSLSPADVANALAVLRSLSDNNPDGPTGSAGVPVPVKPLPPSLAGGHAKPIARYPEAGLGADSQGTGF